MPKNIVATPAAVVAVDRLTLQADDVRRDGADVCGVFLQGLCNSSCFSEE